MSTVVININLERIQYIDYPTKLATYMKCRTYQQFQPFPLNTESPNTIYIAKHCTCKLFICEAKPIVEISIPSMIISPFTASMIRNNAKVKLDLPAPVLPTIPICYYQRVREGVREGVREEARESLRDGSRGRSGEGRDNADSLQFE